MEMIWNARENSQKSYRQLICRFLMEEGVEEFYLSSSQIIANVFLLKLL